MTKEELRALADRVRKSGMQVRFEDGGDKPSPVAYTKAEYSSPEEADAAGVEFNRTWLDNRRPILENNAKRTYWEDPTKAYDMEIGMMNGAKVLTGIPMDPGVGGRTRYNGIGKEENEWIQVPKSREYDNNTLGTVGVHEAAHSLGVDKPQEYVMRRHAIMPVGGAKQFHYYLDNATEMYSRLQQLRNDAHLDPNRVYTQDDIDAWRKEYNENPGLTKENSMNPFVHSWELFDRYSDDDMLFLLNDVAQNPLDKDYTNYAARGGQLQNSFEPGGFIPLTLDEIIRQRNDAGTRTMIQRVLNARSAETQRALRGYQNEWDTNQDPTEIGEDVHAAYVAAGARPETEGDLARIRKFENDAAATNKAGLGVVAGMTAQLWAPAVLPALANPLATSTKAGAMLATAADAAGLVSGLQGLGDDLNSAVHGNYSWKDVPQTLLDATTLIPGSSVLTNIRNLAAVPSGILDVGIPAARAVAPTPIGKRAAETAMRMQAGPFRSARRLWGSEYGIRNNLGYILTGNENWSHFGHYSGILYPYTEGNVIPRNKDMISAYLYGTELDPRVGRRVAPDYGVHTDYVKQNYPDKDIPVYEIGESFPTELFGKDALPYSVEGEIRGRDSRYSIDASGHVGVPILKDYIPMYYEQDIWKFNPEDYFKRWTGRAEGNNFGSFLSRDVMSDLINRIGVNFVDAAGTPVITRTTPGLIKASPEDLRELKLRLYKPSGSDLPGTGAVEFSPEEVSFDTDIDEIPFDMGGKLSKLAERLQQVGYYKKGGKIHIDPSKKGTFTAAAKKHGKSVQGFASQVLAHKENYSHAMVKKANFARNAAKWHGDGGPLGSNIFELGGTWDPRGILPVIESLPVEESPVVVEATTGGMPAENIVPTFVQGSSGNAGTPDLLVEVPIQKDSFFQNQMLGIERPVTIDVDSGAVVIPSRDSTAYFAAQAQKATEDLWKFDPSNKSKAEIRDIQKELADSGYYSGQLSNKLKEEIKEIQKKLIQKGFLSGEKKSDGTYKEIDGIAGKKTKEAWNKYNIDGIWGERSNLAYDARRRAESKSGYNWENEFSAKGIDGCAKWVTRKYETVVGAASKKNGVIGNAWQMPMNVVAAGGQQLFNLYDRGFEGVRTEESLKARTRQRLKETPIDYSILKPGDIVGIFYPGSHYYNEALRDGTTYNTHVGIVTGYDKDGMPLVEHNIRETNHKDRADHISYGVGAITVAVRPPHTSIDTYPFELGKSGFEVQLPEGANKVQAEKLETFMDSMAGASDVIGSIYTNADMDAVQKIAVAVLQRETGMMQNTESSRTGLAAINPAIRNLYHAIVGTRAEQKSSDLTKFKLSTLSPDERAFLGISSTDDLEDPAKAGLASMLTLAKNYDYFVRYSEQNPQLGLTKQDIEDLVALSYNQGMGRLYKVGTSEYNGQLYSAPSRLDAIRQAAANGGVLDDFNATKLARISTEFPALTRLMHDLYDRGVGTRSTSYMNSARKAIEKIKNKPN